MAEGHLKRVVLEETALGRLSPPQEADLAQAVADLAAENQFFPVVAPAAHTVLRLSVRDGRLIFDIRDEAGEAITILGLAMGPFKMLVKDYQMLLDSYASAVTEGREARIQAIDMGRRGLHNEGAELLRERLAGRVVVDLPTARRLFTLLCALHRRFGAAHED